ncbi:Stk1 family PASTA domain-containing Ser/Thr kinase [Domibacillus sp. A3M-37]|uniref:Stk1 family PASTA domain-containing Ser/Thr kinase n=1 Tax=Domibacillus sp. A3M-37 TaxID=2962037 RepID=UPI0020B7642A|nr:Stk1 family PASTA domain-containing Ser/Thr kinase [Domibacillus sp. A3M-37]MCP3761949.1 Stk1 family PASTA domain-containing Ser/Thr kinase [Domibacillus sp. A3M-37]
MLIGKSLSGRYKIVRTIGGGGMAHVYLARDMILDRDVAIKVLRFDFAGEDEFLRRFQREAQAASSLAHPNIVNIYDVGEEDNVHFIVMEYVDGMTLKEYIQQFSPVPYEKVIDIMKQMTAAVSFAHQHSIIHRDVKPHNMLMDRDGTVKMTDFGIAMAMSATSITQTNAVLGSVHYISPEQARGGMATKKSDIYALGIVMYELLTGKLPFSGESAVSIALKHLQTETPSIKQLYPGIPQSIENIVLHATAKDPFHRYMSAEEMEHDLSTALEEYRLHEEKFMIPDDNDEVTKAIPVFSPKPPERIQPTVSSSEKKQEMVPLKKKKKWPWILLFLITLSILGVIAWTVATTPRDAEVPETNGNSPEAAASMLINAGFIVGDSDEEFSADIEQGKVIRTVPEAGETVKEGSEIDLFVSAGKERKAMADYTGKTLEETRELLEEAGFRNVETEMIYDESEAGTVLEQNPNVDERVIPEESDVELTVSAGLANVVLTDLAGYTEKSLEDYGDSNGIIIDISGEEFSNSVSAGQVISQSPQAGNEVEPGSTVEVTLSKGPEEIPLAEVSTEIVIPYEPETEGDPQEVQIYMEDATHSMTEPYEKFLITEETKRTLEFVVEKGEKAGYKVMRDQVVIIDETIPYPEETESE